MTKKLSKLSLKEFYEHHGSKNAITCLPTKPGDVGGADQGFNNRLADLSLDSRSTSKPYYQDDAGHAGQAGYSRPAPRFNGHSNYGSYSNGPSGGSHPLAHGNGSNTSDVSLAPGSGDFDYYKPATHAPYAGGAAPPYYSRGPHAAGPYPGPPPAAGGPGPAEPRAPAVPGAAAVGNGGSYDAPHAYPGPYSHPPAYPPGAHGAPAAVPSRPAGPYAGGPCHGPPPAAPAAGEDVWYPPPPPPPPRASLNSQQLPAAAASEGGFSAACGEGPAAPATAPGRSAGAPPPPPRKQVEQMAQQAQGQAQRTAAGPAGDGLARAVAPGTAGGAAAAKSAMVAQQVAATELERARKPEVGEQVKAATPFASVPAAAAAPAAAAPPAPAGPRNEFAEKLAQKAMASAARAKSSLLAGGSISASGSLSSALSGGGGLASGGQDGGVAGEQGGAFVKPAHPFGKPRLVLKPRSAPVADSRASTPTAHGGGNTSSASSDSGTEVEHSSGSVASSGAGRPRLQLQPRSLSLADDGTAGFGSAAAGAAQDASGRPRLSLLPRGSSSSTGPDRQGSVGSTAGGEGATGAARKPSVFGAAKPREEVLKGRGEDPVLVEAGLSRSAGSGTHRLSEAAVARLGNGSGGSGRWGGSHVSGGDDEWHTVSAHGRTVSSNKYSEVGGSALLLGEDPFFGSSSGGGSGYTAVPAPRAFERDIMRDGRAYGRSGGSYDEGGYGSYGSRKGGLYGSPAGGWGGKQGYGGGMDDAEGDVDGGVFRRALPTRQSPLAF